MHPPLHLHHLHPPHPPTQHPLVSARRAQVQPRAGAAGCGPAGCGAGGLPGPCAAAGPGVAALPTPLLSVCCHSLLVSIWWLLLLQGRGRGRRARAGWFAGACAKRGGSVSSAWHVCSAHSSKRCGPPGPGSSSLARSNPHICGSWPATLPPLIPSPPCAHPTHRPAVSPPGAL